jgi:hypothetical protein
VDWNELLNVATLIALAGAGAAVGTPTSSLERRLLLRNVEQRRRVSSLHYMYRITVQNILLWNKDKYSFRHPQYCSYVMWKCQCNCQCNCHCLWTLCPCAPNTTALRTPNYNVPVSRSEVLYNGTQICKFFIKLLPVILCFNLNRNWTSVYTKVWFRNSGRCDNLETFLNFSIKNKLTKSP